MTAHKYPDPIPLHEVPPPDSDARREAHIREAVGKIPAPPFAGTDRDYLAHIASEIYQARVELVHMRVGVQRAEDRNQSAHATLSDQIAALSSEVAGLGRHVETRDSVSNEAAIETAERVESARRVASEAKTVAVEAKTVADRAWAIVGKGGVLSFAGGGLVALVRYLFF